MQTLLTKKHIIWEKKKNINKLRIYLKNLEKEGGKQNSEGRNDEDKTRNIWITKTVKVLNKSKISYLKRAWQYSSYPNLDDLKITPWAA